jgi:hypothetical protein
MHKMSPLHAIPTKRRSGNEWFREGEGSLAFNLLGFWQWGFSDLVSNVTRGLLAEYLVAQALGGAHGVREEWAAYDLETADGTLIEVKSAAYLQSWQQKQPSKIVFNVPRTHAWDSKANQRSSAARRQAHVYVFALLQHDDKSTIEPLDVSQWVFYVVHAERLEGRMRNQRSISLSSLKQLCERSVPYQHLAGAVKDARRLQEASLRPAKT